MTYEAFTIEGEARQGRWLVTCDHASNEVPLAVCGGDLGLPAAEFARHIAFDPGALGTARALAEGLDCPLVYSRFSRLVIDPNRGVDDPTLLMRLYDGTIIPGNRHAGTAERARRLELCYLPYDRALARMMARPGIAVVSVHSFTRQLSGRAKRPWDLGILYGADRRLADPLMARLHPQMGARLGDNQPYAGHLPGDSMDRHAARQGIAHVLLELCNDQIEGTPAQREWAARLTPHLIAARQEAGL